MSAPGFGRLTPIRQQIIGEILADPRRSEHVEARFWAKVDRSGECWIWTSARARQGYGQFFLARRPEGHIKEMAHRFALALKLGRPLKLDALHSCHNPSCVRPSHLREGTHQENLDEMKAAGRCVRGEGRWSAKLTEAKVIDMRERAARGASIQMLANENGVSHSTAMRAIRGKNWSHLPFPRALASGGGR